MKRLYTIEIITSEGKIETFVLTAFDPLQGKLLAKQSIERRGLKALGVKSCKKMKAGGLFHGLI
jgi:hypothetical protein